MHVLNGEPGSSSVARSTARNGTSEYHELDARELHVLLFFDAGRCAQVYQMEQTQDYPKHVTINRLVVHKGATDVASGLRWGWSIHP
jgi:hypothetical protein